VSRFNLSLIVILLVCAALAALLYGVAAHGLKAPLALILAVPFILAGRWALQRDRISARKRDVI
jgi:hypothetical protein